MQYRPDERYVPVLALIALAAVVAWLTLAL